MASNLNSSNKQFAAPSAKDMRFGIVVSQWNYDVTSSLLEGSLDALLGSGCLRDNIDVRWVPGAFELPLGSQYFAELGSVDGVIALGCVIQGDTPHFTYVCQGATNGIMQLQLQYAIPISFGLLTVETPEQAYARAGGASGNKGVEAAHTAIHMVQMFRDMGSVEDVK